MYFVGLLDQIPYSPEVLPSEWCLKQPCIEIGGLIISQPSSSVIVFLAAIIGVFVGWELHKNNSGQESKRWFGFSLILGGIGAFLAGTSYQAFGYELKCAGREICNWTSWWELGYELVTVIAAAYLLLAVVKMCFSERWLNISKIFAVILSITYAIVLTTGVIQKNQFLLSFELMLLFSTPLYVIILVANGIQWVQTRNKHIAKLALTWLLLFSVILGYYGYLVLGFTETLWANGIWFSENDVLHVGMILWLLYIHFSLPESIQDNLLSTDK